MVSNASQSTLVISLLFILQKVSDCLPSFILTCCLKCNCYSDLIAPSLILRPFLMLLLSFSFLSLFSTFPLFLVISLTVCAGFFVSPWKYPHLLFLLTWALSKGKRSIFLAEAALPSSGYSSWCYTFFTPVCGNDSPSSVSFVLPYSKSTTILCFSASKLDLRIFPSHCSALWITLCCLFCAVSCKSSFLLSCFWAPLEFFVCFLHNPWLFYHRCKCRTRTHLSFCVPFFQCETSFPFSLLLQSRVLPCRFCSMGPALKLWQCFS